MSKSRGQGRRRRDGPSRDGEGGEQRDVRWGGPSLAGHSLSPLLISVRPSSDPDPDHKIPSE